MHDGGEDDGDDDDGNDYGDDDHANNYGDIDVVGDDRSVNLLYILIMTILTDNGDDCEDDYISHGR